MAKGKFEYWLTPDGLLRLEAYARDGLTDNDISLKIGINRATLYDWKNKYPDISDSLKKGKEVVDIAVENALYKRAIGFEYEETKQIIEKDKSGKEKKRIEKTKKFVPPDTTAQIFWLKNRKPADWRDKREIENTTEVDKLAEILTEMKNNAIKQKTE